MNPVPRLATRREMVFVCGWKHALVYDLFLVGERRPCSSGSEDLG